MFTMFTRKGLTGKGIHTHVWKLRVQKLWCIDDILSDIVEIMGEVNDKYYIVILEVQSFS